MMRAALAWPVYLTGVLFWRYGAGAWAGHYWEWPYAAYNGLMNWSYFIQGNSQYGPWLPWIPEAESKGDSRE